MSFHLRRVLAKQIVKCLKKVQPGLGWTDSHLQETVVKSLTLKEVRKKSDVTQPQFNLHLEHGDADSDWKHLQSLTASFSSSKPQAVGDWNIGVSDVEWDQLKLRVSPTDLSQELIKYIHQCGDQYGYQGEQLIRGDHSSGQKTVVVEFSSPNIAKPFHAGHLRSTIIGNFVANLYQSLGYRVIRLNFLGDWGTQYGLLAVGFQRYGDLSKLETSPLSHLFEVYVRINQDAAAEEKGGEAGTNTEAREVLRKMEEGDEELLLLWEKFRDLSLQEYKKVYERLGVQFTEYHFESMYRNKNICVIEDLKRLSLLQVDQESGKSFVKVDTVPEQQSNVTILKSDGASLYITRDIAALLDRYDRYKFDRIHYIVSHAQSLHFKHLLGLVRQLVDWSADRICETDFHVKFGQVKGMKTRKGEVVFLKDILDEAKQRMITSLENHETTKVVENLEEVADTLGVSAIIVQDLRRQPVKDYQFSWEQCLRFNGDSGVFLQYAHARLCSIERNSGVRLQDSFDPACLDKEEAQMIVLHLARYEDIINKVFETKEPHHIVAYLCQLCKLVNAGYRVLRVKGEEENVAQAHLQLFSACRVTLSNGMRLLGLVPLEKM